MPQEWEQKVKEYCKKYNIPLYYLSDTLYEPKVVPMIRGKAFEFSVMMALQEVLPNDWVVDKPSMNAQLGFHDVDVRVQHKQSQRVVSVECKLAGKGSFKHKDDGHDELRVKCMRSRTLGRAKVRELAPQLGVEPSVLAVHNDQYLPADFDIVVTSIGNAFYETDSDTGRFEWRPTEDGIDFLYGLGASEKENLQDFAFNALYVARAKDIVIGNNGVKCTRRGCRRKRSCGFIPNYPIIKFDLENKKPVNGWLPITESVELFQSFI